MKKIKVEGMSCQHCANTVTNALNALPGITNVRVSLEDKEVAFDAEPEVDMELVRETVRQTGYKVSG